MAVKFSPGILKCKGQGWLRRLQWLPWILISLSHCTNQTLSLWSSVLEKQLERRKDLFWFTFSGISVCSPRSQPSWAHSKMEPHGDTVCRRGRSWLPGEHAAENEKDWRASNIRPLVPTFYSKTLLPKEYRISQNSMASWRPRSQHTTVTHTLPQSSDGLPLANPSHNNKVGAPNICSNKSSIWNASKPIWVLILK